MIKSSTYYNTFFGPEVHVAVADAFERVLRAVPEGHYKTIEGGSILVATIRYESLNVSKENHTWTFDEVSEFYGELRQTHTAAEWNCSMTNIFATDGNLCRVSIKEQPYGTAVTIKLPRRSDVEEVSYVIESRLNQYTQASAEPLVPAQVEPTIFVGHGRSGAWRDLKDHLVDLHKHKIVAYESGSRTGHTIRDVLDGMLDQSSLAIIVMTAEDEQADETFRARQNVVHEAGLFQGRLGFARVAILSEVNVALLSNIEGVQRIVFSSGNIRETFGDVLAFIGRETASMQNS